MNLVHRFLLGATIAAALATAIPLRGAGLQPQTAKERLRQGIECLERGEFDKAADLLRGQASGAGHRETKPAQIDRLIYLSAAYQALGQHKLAVGELNNALPLAHEIRDRQRLASIQCALAATYTLLGHPDGAESALMKAARELLDESLRWGGLESGTPSTVAAVLNNYGNWFSAQRKHDDAVTKYRAAAEAAEKATNSLFVGQSLANAARAALFAGKSSEAQEFARQARTRLEKLPASHQKANLQTLLGRTTLLLSSQSTVSETELRTVAAADFQAAQRTSYEVGSQRALCYAQGYLARLYEIERRYDEALLLTRKALLTANFLGLADATFRWEWQSARLLKAQRQSAAAVASYWRAVDAYQEIRQDLALGCGNQSSEGLFESEEFERGTGGLFRELAETLFGLAKASDSSHRQRHLEEVRRAIEILRSAELEDYLRDECASLVRSRSPRIESISLQTAVLYIVSANEQLELLLGLSSGSRGTFFEHRSVLVRHQALMKRAEECRFFLEKGTTEQYLAPAWDLHRWLIAPIEPILAEHKITTLVIVADGALRTIPFAALHDGNGFVVRKYATAVTPALTLIEPKPVARNNARVLVGALSVSRNRHAALPHVKQEVETIQLAYPRSDVLSNDAFTAANWTRRLADGRYPIVHIASHGKFEPNARNSFIQTYDGTLDLNELERCVRPKKFRGQPVELLVLSACQTAVGDDRAALGLAGVAVKSGARSVLATLWHVNDEASSRLVSEFYWQLRERPSLSKSEALRAAQIHLLEEGWVHPRYWSPYLIIGNWL